MFFFYFYLCETSGIKNIVRPSPRAFLLRVGECTTSNSQNSFGYTKTHSLWVFLIKTIWPTVAHYTEGKKPYRTQSARDTQAHMQTHTYVSENTHFKCSSFLARQIKNNLIGFWEHCDIFLPWWSSLIGRQNIAQCSVAATSAVCLMTCGRCRAHIHLCGRLSTSFKRFGSWARPHQEQLYSFEETEGAFWNSGHVFRPSGLCC